MPGWQFSGLDSGSSWSRFTARDDDPSEEVEGADLNGRVVVLLDFVCDGVFTLVILSHEFSRVVSCFKGVSKGIFTGADRDLENSLLYSLLSPSSIFLFLRPGFAGLIGAGREEEVEVTPSGFTKQKMHGS